MTKTAPSSVPPPTDDVSNGLKRAGEDMLRTWSHGMDLYSRYLNALSKAKTPQDILIANADLITDGAARVSGAFFSRDDNSEPALTPPSAD